MLKQEQRSWSDIHCKVFALRLMRLLKVLWVEISDIHCKVFALSLMHLLKVLWVEITDMWGLCKRLSDCMAMFFVVKLECMAIIMCVCVRVWMCVCVCGWVGMSECVWACVRACVCFHIFTEWWHDRHLTLELTFFVCVHACTPPAQHACMCAHTHTHTHTHTARTHTHFHHLHTHRHTLIQAHTC